MLALSQCPQIFSISGFNASALVSHSSISFAKVFSAPGTIGGDLAFINASGNPVVISSRFAKMALEKWERPSFEVEAGLNAKPMHLAGRCRAHAMKFIGKRSAFAV
jgi:hypothetical protein